MFEYFYDVYFYDVCDDLSIFNKYYQNKDCYFCRLFLMPSHEHD